MEQKDFFEYGYIKIKAEDYEKMQQKFQNQAEKIEHLQQQVDILLRDTVTRCRCTGKKRISKDMM